MTAAIDHIRAQTLSAPSCSFFIGDRVFCRRNLYDHEFPARVVGRYFGSAVYDVETADGATIKNITIIRLDEDAQRVAMAAEALA